MNHTYTIKETGPLTLELNCSCGWIYGPILMGKIYSAVESWGSHFREATKTPGVYLDPPPSPPSASTLINDPGPDRIHPYGKYQTRHGCEVTIYRIHSEEGGDYGVHGAFRTPSGRWEVAVWTIYGRSSEQSELDLVPVQMPKQVRWVNIYDGQYSDDVAVYLHKTKQAADKMAKESTSQKRIACVPVFYREGEGL